MPSKKNKTKSKKTVATVEESKPEVIPELKLAENTEKNGEMDVCEIKLFDIVLEKVNINKHENLDNDIPNDKTSEPVNENVISTPSKKKRITKSKLLTDDKVDSDIKEVKIPGLILLNNAKQRKSMGITLNESEKNIPGLIISNEMKRRKSGVDIILDSNDSNINVDNVVPENKNTRKSVRKPIANETDNNIENSEQKNVKSSMRKSVRKTTDTIIKHSAENSEASDVYETTETKTQSIKSIRKSTRKIAEIVDKKSGNNSEVSDISDINNVELQNPINDDSDKMDYQDQNYNVVEPIKKVTKNAGLKRKSALRVDNSKKTKIDEEMVKFEEAQTNDKLVENQIKKEMDLKNKITEPKNDIIPGLALLNKALEKKAAKMNKPKNLEKSVIESKEKEKIPELKDTENKMESIKNNRSSIKESNDIIPGLKSKQESVKEIRKSIKKPQKETNDIIPGLKPQIQEICKGSPIPGLKSFNQETVIPGFRNKIINQTQKTNEIIPGIYSSHKTAKSEQKESKTFIELKREEFSNVLKQSPIPSKALRLQLNPDLELIPGIKRLEEEDMDDYDNTETHFTSRKRRLIDTSVADLEESNKRFKPESILTPNSILKSKVKPHEKAPIINTNKDSGDLTRRQSVKFHNLVEIKEFDGNSFNSDDGNDSTAHLGFNPFSQMNNNSVNHPFPYTKYGGVNKRVIAQPKIETNEETNSFWSSFKSDVNTELQTNNVEKMEGVEESENKTKCIIM